MTTKQITNTREITFTNVVGGTVAGSTLTKTASDLWGNCGAFSIESLDDNGTLELVTPAITVNVVLGLSNTDASQSYDTIPYGIYFATGTIIVSQLGVLTPSFGAFTALDTFSIQVQDDVVYYKKNGTVFYTSLVTPTFPLYFDCALYTQTAAVDAPSFTTIVSSFNTCLVWGYVLDVFGDPIPDVTASFNLVKTFEEYKEAANLIINKGLTAITDANGYFEISLISSDEYRDSGKYVVVFTGTNLLISQYRNNPLNITVPNADSVNITSLVV